MCVCVCVCVCVCPFLFVSGDSKVTMNYGVVYCVTVLSLLSVNFASFPTHPSNPMFRWRWKITLESCPSYVMYVREASFLPDHWFAGTLCVLLCLSDSLSLSLAR